MSFERVFVSCAAITALAAFACGGDGGDDDVRGETVRPTNPAGGETVGPTNPTGEETVRPTNPAALVLLEPVSRFALALDDLPVGFFTDRASTFVLDSALYGGTSIFESTERGQQMLESWGYVGGYETAFEPEQRMTAVLNGGYYVAVEVHLFANPEGADEAFEYFESRLILASDKLSSPMVGNQSSAWKLTSGKVPGSNSDAVYHRVVFERGNLVAVVQTYGADTLMTIDTALDLAEIVDLKALGEIPAVEPTPLGQTSESGS